MKILKETKAVTILNLIFISIHSSFGFSECPNSGITDPLIPNVFNCLSWVAYLKSQGQNLQQWCNVPNNYKKCCLTCQNLGTQDGCTDVGSTLDCEVKANQGLCTEKSPAGVTVRIYCQKTCGLCPTSISVGTGELSCAGLTVDCHTGTCAGVTYFQIPSIKCTCPSSTAGDYCQRKNSCNNSPCINGGVCTSLNDEDTLYTCSCPNKFSGKNCEITDGNQGTSCSSINCINGGRCQLNSFNQPECICLNGFSGTMCEILPCQNACLNNPCVNGGTCKITGTSGYTCICPSGITGINCQGSTNSKACSLNQCKNGATCYETSATNYGCACPGGFYGIYCERTAIGPINQNGCQNNPCSNGGTCQRLGTSGYICLCPIGFSGVNCQGGSTGPCKNNQCKNGATCFATSKTDYSCACVSGFYGTFCETTQNFDNSCQINPCQNEGTCQPTASGYICLCPPGISGTNCQGSVSVPCLTNQCKNGATCFATSTTEYSCACSSNYYGQYCETSRTVCKSDSCKNGGTCKEISNLQFICICPVNNTGFYCNETSSNNLISLNTRELKSSCEKHQCKNGATCYEIGESVYGCACTGGFIGKYCSEKTLNSLGSTTKSTIKLTTKQIVKLATISTTEKKMSTKFHSVTDSIKIKTTLSIKNKPICEDNSCLNGGMCSVDNDSIECNCLGGFFGNRCEITNACVNNPCKNGGACFTTGPGNYNCSCTSQFAGDNCELSSCHSKPCLNGGLCLISGNEPYCKCLPGFTGSNCEFLTSCNTKPCQNGGSCIEDANRIQCKCPPKFYGQYCENQITAEICIGGDQHETDCKIWQFYGFCSFSYTYNAVPVPIFCPDSCKLCSNNGICEDTQINCGIWLNLGLCQSVNQIDQYACRKSCGFCT